MTLRQLCVATVLITAVAGSWWIAADRDPPGLPAVDAEELPPGYYLRDTRLLTMDDDGRLAFALRADEARQASDGAPVRLYNVVLDYTPELDVPWDVRGTEATLEPGSRLIYLSAGVEAVSRPDNGRSVRLRTEALFIDPDTYRAWTEEPVEVDTEDGQLRSRGFTAYLREDRLQLMAEIHGTFRP